VGLVQPADQIEDLVTGVATVSAKREHERQLALARPSGDRRRRDVEQPRNIGASQVPSRRHRFHPE